MKKVLAFVVGVLVVSGFTACSLPKYPIDETPSVKVDARLLGTWKAKVKGETETYTLTREGDYQYLVTAKKPGNKKKELMNAYLSMVDTIRFLNVYDRGDTEKRYFFMRLLEINAAGNRLRACGVDDTNMQHLPNAKAVREYVVKNINRPSFYGDTAWFEKVK